MRGHIHKRVHVCKDGRKSVSWWVIVDAPRGADGKRRQKWHGGYETKKIAEAVRARLVTQLMSGTYILPSPIPLSEWFDNDWFPAHKSRIKLSTARAYESAFRLHIAPHIGGVEMGNLTPRLLNELYQTLLASGRCDGTGGLSLSTVKGVHLILHKTLQDAHDMGMIPTNPADKAKPPRPRAHRIELPYWTSSEIREFLALCKGHRLEAAYRLLVVTGARRGEIAGLEWRDIDLDVGRITIRQSLLAGTGGAYVSSPKTYRGRSVDIDFDTIRALRRHKRKQSEEGATTRGWEDSGFVFTKPNGSHLDPRTLSTTFKWIIGKSDLRDVRLHSLRHSSASLSILGGVPIPIVAQRLGHSTPQTTLEIYSHVVSTAGQDAAARVAAAVLNGGQ